MSERLTTSVELARSDAPSWSVRAWLDRFGMVLILPALLGMGGIISPAFISLDNLSNLLLQFAPLAIVAMGQALVMIVRGLDLSVASMMATAAVIATSLSGSASGVVAVLAVALLVAVAIGLLNGFLVTKRQVSPFLATLATMILLQGLRFAYTQGAPSGNVPPLLRMLGAGKFHGIPSQCAGTARARRSSRHSPSPIRVRPQDLHCRRQPRDRATVRHPV